MQATERIVLLGGASAFTPLLAEALAARSPELPPLDLVIEGRSARRARDVAAFCGSLASERGAAHRWRAARGDDDWRGARLFINQIRPGGWAGREFDETYCHFAGVPGDETVGPGGLSSALRGGRLVCDFAARARAASPEAWFLNLTNPMSILLRALDKAGLGERTFGLCELPGTTLAAALALVGVDPEEVEPHYLGVNHQGWFVRLERDGSDLLPEIARAQAALDDPGFLGVDGDRMERLGALPLPYMRLYYHTQRELEKQRGRAESRGAELAILSDRLHRHWAARDTSRIPDEARQRSTPWIDQAVVPAVCALLGGQPAELWVSMRGGVPGANIGEESVAERLMRVDARGPTELGAVGRIEDPRDPRLLMLRRIVDFEEAAACAALADNDEARVAEAERALLLHPFEFSLEHARALALAAVRGRSLDDVPREAAAGS